MSSPVVNSTSLRFKTFRNTNDEIPTMRDNDRSDHIPDLHNIMTTANSEISSVLGDAQCCCGKPECAYLQHNAAALSTIERDLDKAAKLGQVRAVARALVIS
jgi:hypothetical protein